MRFLILALVLCAVLPAQAQQPIREWTNQEVEHLCLSGQVPDDISPPAIRTGALEVRRMLCVQKGTRRDVEDAFVRFVSELARTNWFKDFGGFSGGGNPFEPVRSRINLEKQEFPTLILSAIDPPALVQSDAPQSFVPADLATCDELAGKDKDGKVRSCRDVLEGVRALFEYARFTLEAKRVLQFTEQVTALGNQWEQFLFKSRSQTILELAINSAIWRSNEPRQFGPPPSRQLIILHPDVVIENVDEAVSGDKSKEALMVELFGVNWWNQKRWYVPTGVSAIALYADRSNVDDVGYGVAVHFRSVYTIGYADHGGDGGFFVSMDLLKLVEDKKSMLEKYTR